MHTPDNRLWSPQVRNLQPVNDLTLTHIRESTVATAFADADMHPPYSFHHVHGRSRKRDQEFLFQEVDLEDIF